MSLCAWWQNINAQTNFNIDLLDHWKDTTIASANYNIRFNEVYGFVMEGKEYAVIGSTEGTHIFDLKNNVINELAFVPGNFSSNLVYHRDYHVYKNYLYAVCDEGFSTLQILDLSNLPNEVTLVYDSNEFLVRCHNIFIDTSSALLFACDAVGGFHPNLTYSGIEVLDLSDPINPQPIKLQFPALPNRVHDAFVRNDTAYFNCYFEGVQIFEFSNPEYPKKIGHMETYTDQGMNHSGWLDDNADYYYMIDETPGMRIKVVEVFNLPTIRVRALFGTNYQKQSVPHNIMIKGNFAYVAYYNEGLRIYDVSNIFDIKEVGFYDTFPIEQTFKMHGAWGIYALLPSGRLLVSDRQNGLFLLEPQVDKAIAGTKYFSVFPNPTKDHLTINMELVNYPEEFYQIYIIDASGKVVFQSEKEKQSVFSINVSQWNKGIYLIGLTNEGGLIYDSYKFMVD